MQELYEDDYIYDKKLLLQSTKVSFKVKILLI